MTRICNPFLTVDMNFFDKSMIISDSTMAALSTTALSRFDPIGINTATVLINSVVRDIDTSRFPTIKARYEAFPFTAVEIAEFAFNNFYTEFEIIEIINNASVSSAPADKLLQDLEQFLDKNAGAAAANGFCSAIANPFKKLLKIINKINFLLNFSLADIFSMIKAQIEALKEKLLAMIDKLIEGVLSKLQNIMKRIAEFKNALYDAGTKIALIAKSVFSTKSIEILKENVKNTIDRLVGQFPQPLTLEAGMTILFRMCQMIEKLQQLFQNPLKAVENFVKDSQLYTTNLTNQSNAILSRTNAYGVPVMNYTARNNIVQQRLAELNGGGHRTNSVQTTTLGSSPTPIDNVYRGTCSGEVDRILDTIKGKESGGDYSVLTGLQDSGRNQTASGAYQFIDSTWQGLTQQFGIGTEYKSARSAPPEVQDAVARRQVEKILADHNGDVSMVPIIWYTGNSRGYISPEVLALNNNVTPAEYQAAWMKRFESNGGVCRDPVESSYQSQHPGYSYVQLTDEERQWNDQLTIQTAQSDPDLVFSAGDSERGTGGILYMARKASELYNNGSGPTSYWDPTENFYSDTTDAGLNVCVANGHKPFVKLRRIARKMGIKLILNSAYRSDYYQEHITTEPKAKPEKSPHRTGEAIDINFPEGDSAKAELVELLSREGFTRFGVYGTFIHADHNPYNGWDGPAFDSASPMLKDAIRKHYAGVFKTDTAPITPSTGGR